MNKEFKILDGILRYLLKNGNKSFSSIKEDDKLKSEISLDIENNTLASAFIKLVKDGYVNINEQTIGLKMDNSPRNVDYYNISFEGIFFIKDGGYHQALLEAQRKENAYDVLKTEQRKQSISLLWLNRWVAFGAVVVAIDSILNILHFFGVYFDTSNFLFCVKPT